MNLKTYPLGSKEAMKREPSLEEPRILQGSIPQWTCENGHEDCANYPYGDCWLNRLREEQFQAQMYDAMNDNYLQGES